MTDRRGNRRVMEGVVVSNKMTKTVVVEVTRLCKHRFYHKYITRRARYKAHDERNEFQIGDKVQIVESRPFSRHKRWRVKKLLDRPQVA